MIRFVFRRMQLVWAGSKENKNSYVGLISGIISFISSVLIIIAAILTGVGVFDKIAKHAGAGTIVPITGFANSVVSPALEFKSEGLIMGTGANIFKIAGPVIAYGIFAGVIYGLIAYLLKLY